MLPSFTSSRASRQALPVARKISRARADAAKARWYSPSRMSGWIDALRVRAIWSWSPWRSSSASAWSWCSTAARFSLSQKSTLALARMLSARSAGSPRPRATASAPSAEPSARFGSSLATLVDLALEPARRFGAAELGMLLEEALAALVVVERGEGGRSSSRVGGHGRPRARAGLRPLHWNPRSSSLRRSLSRQRPRMKPIDPVARFRSPAISW